MHSPCLGQPNNMCVGEPFGAHSVKVMAGVFVGQGEQGLYAGGSRKGPAIACNNPSISMYAAGHGGLVREPHVS